MSLIECPDKLKLLRAVDDIGRNDDARQSVRERLARQAACSAFFTLN